MVEKVLIEQLGNILYCDYISKIILLSTELSYDDHSESETLKCMLDDPLTSSGVKMLNLSDSVDYDYYIVRRKRGQEST